MTPFSVAQSLISDTLKALAGLAGTYHRGSGEAAVTGVAGETRIDIVEDGGTSIRSKVRDWILVAAELVINGDTIKPKVGDVMRFPGESVTEVYEVAAIAGEVWRQSTTDGKRIRVHSRLVRTESIGT